MRKSLQELQTKGENLFRKFLPKFRKELKESDFVALDVRTGEYLSAETLTEVVHKARRKKAKGQFFFSRVGGRPE